VLSSDLKPFRAHIGFMTTKGDDRWFAGVDRTQGRLTLRADWIEEMNEQIFSFGLLYALGQRVILEGWASFPTSSGAL